MGFTFIKGTNKWMDHGRTRSVVGPNKFRKYSALSEIQSDLQQYNNRYFGAHATILRLYRISVLETTAKYATLIRR